MRLVSLLFIFVLLGTQNGGPTSPTAVTTAATAENTPAKAASKFHFYSAVTVHMVVMESSAAQHGFNGK